MFSLFIILTLYVILNYVLTFFTQKYILSSEFIEKLDKSKIVKKVLRLIIVLVTYAALTGAFAAMFKFKVFASILGVLIILASYLITDFAFPVLVKKMITKFGLSEKLDIAKMRIVSLDQLLHVIFIIWACLAIVNIKF